MRNLKKILALVLALMMVVSVMATASAAGFVDADEITKVEAVNVMAGLGILSGNPNADGTFTFDPNGTLTRGQAAKILAYIVTGDNDYVVDVAAHLSNPFTDSVGHWAEAYIAYCYDEGLISGTSATTFAPNAPLSGYALGKLMLCAAGIGTKADYEGLGWEVAVYKALKSNNLLTGVSVSKDNITREDACQLAWNVMNWSPAGATTEYIVKDGATVVYQGTDSLTAALIKNAVAGATMSTKVTPVGSLADRVFKLVETAKTDAYGRVTKQYTSKVEGMKVTLANDSTPITFATPVAFNKGLVAYVMNALLELEGDDQLVAADDMAYIMNGDAAYAGNINVGDTVEVYLNEDGDEIVKVIIIHEELTFATCGDLIEEGDDAGKYVWTFAGDTDYTVNAAKDAYTDEAFYMVIAKGTTVLAVNNVGVTSNAKVTKADNATLAAASYIYAGDTKLPVVPGFDNLTEAELDFDTAYDYIKNSNGYVVAITAAQTASTGVQLETGYAWLLGAQKQITSTNTSLLGSTYSWSVAAKAKLALPDGTVAVVDLTVKTDTNDYGQVDELVINGVKLGSVDADSAPTNLIGATGTKDGSTVNVLPEAGWVKYTIQEDGTYTLTEIGTTVNYYLNRNNAKVKDTDGNYKYATSTTVWTEYVFDVATQTIKTTEKVGISSFNDKRHEYVYVTNPLVNPNQVLAINSFKVKEVEVAGDEFAYFVKVGDYVGAKDSNAYNFYVEGATKEYFLGDLAEGSVAAADMTAGAIYTLDFDTDGAITCISELDEKYTVRTGVVSFVDDTFIVVDNNAYYFYYTETYNVTSTGKGVADTVSVGDEITFVTYYYADGYVHDISVIYITKEAK